MRKTSVYLPDELKADLAALSRRTRESEAELISGYLPAELADEELDRMIAAAIAETGASTPRDMGQVMKAVMTASGGRADGKRASARVRGALGA